MKKRKKDTLSNIASHPVAVISSYILTTVGFLFSLSDNLILQIVAISIMAICFSILAFAFIRYRLNVKKEKECMKKQFEETYCKNTQNIVSKSSNISLF